MPLNPHEFESTITRPDLVYDAVTSDPLFDDVSLTIERHNSPEPHLGDSHPPLARNLRPPPRSINKQTRKIKTRHGNFVREIIYSLFISRFTFKPRLPVCDKTRRYFLIRRKIPFDLVWRNVFFVDPRRVLQHSARYMVQCWLSSENSRIVASNLLSNCDDREKFWVRRLLYIRRSIDSSFG